MRKGGCFYGGLPAIILMKLDNLRGTNHDGGRLYQQTTQNFSESSSFSVTVIARVLQIDL
jgi:hypothetical protein